MVFSARSSPARRRDREDQAAEGGVSCPPPGSLRETVGGREPWPIHDEPAG